MRETGFSGRWDVKVEPMNINKFSKCLHSFSNKFSVRYVGDYFLSHCTPYALLKWHIGSGKLARHPLLGILTGESPSKQRGILAFASFLASWHSVGEGCYRKVEGFTTGPWELLHDDASQSSPQAALTWDTADLLTTLHSAATSKKPVLWQIQNTIWYYVATR